MGIEPTTPVLPRLCATSARHGQVDLRWAVRDSNPRSRRQLIYSQPHLATLVTAQDEKPPSDKRNRILSIPQQEDGLPDGTGGSKTCYTRHKEYSCISRVIDAPIIADPLCHVKHFFSSIQGDSQVVLLLLSTRKQASFGREC